MSASVPSHCFPRSRRLLRRSDFDRVYTKGRRHFAKHMTFFYAFREDGAPRVGFTVARALGGAVQRNRMKRRLREAVRLEGGGFEVPADVVINPKKSLLVAEFDEVCVQVRRAFEVIGKAPRERQAE